MRQPAFLFGANRLGSNSLLDLVVFGKSAAKRCSKILDPNKKNKEIHPSDYDDIIKRFEKIKNSNGKHIKYQTFVWRCNR